MLDQLKGERIQLKQFKGLGAHIVVGKRGKTLWKKTGDYFY